MQPLAAGGGSFRFADDPPVTLSACPTKYPLRSTADWLLSVAGDRTTVRRLLQ